MEQMDITESREMAIKFNDLINMDKKYKFYYDEINNPRVFRFKKSGDDFNSDIDANFILGGIALASEVKFLPEVLLKEFKLQKSATEFKYKHVMDKCNGNFIDNLKSKRLNSLLKWIEKMVHLFTFQILIICIGDLLIL